MACSASARCLLLGARRLGSRRVRALRRSSAEVMATAEQQRDFVPTRPRGDGASERRASAGRRLPATTSAFATANIFARASGYIDKRYVDIGDRVKAGHLLAEITAPELDHQIAQARGHARPEPGRRRSRRRRTCDLAHVTWERDSRSSRRAGSPSSRAPSTCRTSRRWRPARRASPKPTSRRSRRSSRCSRQQKDYQSVVAPFDGVITQRNVDVGSLVQADAVSGTFMFTSCRAT